MYQRTIYEKSWSKGTIWVHETCARENKESEGKLPTINDNPMSLVLRALSGLRFADISRFLLQWLEAKKCYKMQPKLSGAKNIDTLISRTVRGTSQETLISGRLKIPWDRKSRFLVRFMVPLTVLEYIRKIVISNNHDLSVRNVCEGK